MVILASAFTIPGSENSRVISVREKTQPGSVRRSFGVERVQFMARCLLTVNCLATKGAVDENPSAESASAGPSRATPFPLRFLFLASKLINTRYSVIRGH